MDHRRFHWLEKTQVQLAALAALSVTYFAVWPHLRPSDPEGPVSFVPTGSYGYAASFALTVWILAGVAAVATMFSRPEGAMLAAFLGAAGFSLRSESVRPLLWAWQSDLSRLYWQFILEVLLLAVVVFLACWVVGLLRGVIAMLNPNWTWKDPLADVASEQRARAVQRAEQEHAESGARRPTRGHYGFYGFASWLVAETVSSFGAKATQHAGKRGRRREVLLRTVYCTALGTLIAVVLLMLLMKSGERGQVLFAVFASLFLGGLAGHYVFPTPYGLAALVIPVAASVVFYVLVAVSAISGPPDAWTRVPPYAYALPVDWMTVGVGGALLGFWVSVRIHESHYFEKREQRKGS